MVCHGSVVFTRGMTDEGSDYANEGTCAHFLAAYCLDNGLDPRAFVKQVIVMLRDRRTKETHEVFEEERIKDSNFEAVYKISPSEDFCDHVQSYVDYVRELVSSTGGTLHVEQRLSLDFLTGEEDAAGTSDAVIITPDELIIIDLKFGQGVQKHAHKNPQLLMYGSAAYYKYGAIEDFKTLRMVIHQPRLGHVSEAVATIAELMVFEKEVNAAGEIIDESEKAADITPYLHPDEDACRFCKGKATCTALANFVRDTIDLEFTDMSNRTEEDVTERVSVLDVATLSLKAKASDLIEFWLKAVRAKVESLLLTGISVPDFKIVQGKRGARKWADEAEAEAMMKSMRLKEAEMYDMKLVSPTTIEKVLKEKPKCWTRIKPLITQSDGPMSVAPASDKRSAIIFVPVEEDMGDHRFEDLL